MPSYLTTLLTTTTSRYASLRSLIPSNSEQDGDTEDDTHLCRVLRAYYLEKGRPFPAWLPPDPKAPQPVVQPVYSNTSIGAGYGGLQATGGTSKLGSLWDTQPPPQITQPQSLRQGRGTPTAARRVDPYSKPQQREEPAVLARPLPSQRAGSIQTRSDTPPASAGSGGSSVGTASTAQDRLKARLWGAAKQSQAQGQVGQQNRISPAPSGFERAGNNGGRATGGGYNDSGRAGGGGYQDDRSGGSDRPFVAATAPWASNADEFMGGGYNTGGGYQGPPSGGTRNGLPSAPGRRPPGAGGGLPSGPRGMR